MKAAAAALAPAPTTQLQAVAPPAPTLLEWGLLVLLCFCFTAEPSFFLGGAVEAVEGTKSDETGKNLAEGSIRNQILYGSGYLLAICLAARWRLPVAELARRLPALFLLIGFVCVSLVWSDDPNVTLRRCVGLVGSTIVGLYLGWRLEPRQLLTAIGMTLVLCLLISVAAVVAMPDRGRMQEGDLVGNWRGIYRHKNVLGVTSVVAALTFVFAWRARGRWIAPLWGGATLLALVCLVGSRSTTALAAFAITVAAFPLLLTRRLSVPVKFGVTGLLLAIAGCTVLGGIIVAEDVLTSMGKSSDMTGRLPMWKILMGAVAERPLIGSGFGAFWQDGNPYVQEIWANGYFIPIDAHNGLINIVLELGLIGGALFLWWLIGALRASAHVLAREPGAGYAFAILVLFSVYSVSEAIFLRPNGFLYVLMTAVAAQAVLQRDRDARAEQAQPA